MNDELKARLPLLSGKGMWHTNGCNGLYESIAVSDGPHGLRKQDENVKENNKSYESTCYPTASCLAATWDEEIVAKVGESLGKETYNADVSVLLGPGVNIKRSPLCGRNFEYFSEDPFLSGKLGIAYVKSVEAQGVGTSLKHFAGNSQETLRMTSNSRIDERTLREIYLTAFEMVVKEAQPATVMASYNYLNGIHATENSHLLKDILKKEWGFRGAVVSDWGACMDLRRAVPAGMDLEMPDSLGVHMKQLISAYERGLVTEDDLKPAVTRMERLIEKYGLKTRSHGKYTDINPHETAFRAAVSGAVLLKNRDGILPLENVSEITVIGELARTMRFQGGGSSHINTGNSVSALDALGNKGIKVNFAPGYPTETVETDEKLEAEAVTLAEKSNELIVFFGGLTDITEGEGYDRSTYLMPGNQLRLLKKLRELNKKIVFVSFGGAPYDMSFEEDTEAILHMYLGGEAVGEAVAELLTGEANPSGHLAETFPIKMSDTPAYGNFGTRSKEISYKEGIFVGYRHYDSKNIPVRFPFGFGLSYTSFEFGEIKLSETVYEKGELYATFTVTNTGTRAGATVAQIYVENPDLGFPRAHHELKGFKKVFLQPGETKEISIALGERGFSIFDTRKNRFSVVSGNYRICLGDSVNNLIRKADLKVVGYDYGADGTGTDLSTFIGKSGSHLDLVNPGEYSVYNSLEELSKKSGLGRLLLKIAIKVAYDMFKDKPHDDPEVMMMVETIKDGPIDAVMLQGGIPYRLAEMIVKQANRKRK